MRLSRLGGVTSSLFALRSGIGPASIVTKRMSTSWCVEESDLTRSVETNLESVRERVEKANKDATLIAVSKTKPLSLVATAYAAGHRDFGENYIQELVEKAESSKDQDLRWHFIGRLQSNKVKMLCGAPNLYAVHTVHNEKIARALEKHWSGPDPLKVFVQVNTSGEETKGGCEPGEVPELVKIVDACDNIHLVGLMCIGKYSGAEGDASPDFVCLSRCRDQAAQALGLDSKSLALSMGMSHDFETALEHGATHVRVGSTIFGARVYDK